MPLSSVPIIDLTPYFAGSAAGKQAVAKAVDQACRDIGFLVITHHQVPEALVERVSRLSRAFFELPLAEKRKADRPRPDQVRGYSAVAEESLSYSLEAAAPGDLKESFSIGPLDIPETAYYRGPEAGPHFADYLDSATTVVLSIDLHRGHLDASPECPCPALMTW